VSEDAALVLDSVKLNGRPAKVFAFADRLLLVDADGGRTVPMRGVARIAHKAGLRTGRLVITTADGEQLVVKNLKSRDTRTAYRILVRLASEAQA
jgi:hypothetical protein